ncbi:hypothetical protein UY3_02912 [Chelonia mydas]|uniref:Uncharacterized protein n=1 Tax=Chelonia mydas TaxID=8469 RepID=M7CG41_CHEMY|nr:hypothetical protein UY3_02912 [Chelonia mydas]
MLLAAHFPCRGASLALLPGGAGILLPGLSRDPLPCGLPQALCRGYIKYVEWGGAVQLIAAPSGGGSPFPANGGCGKQCGPRDVLATASRRPHWPGTANRDQWELRSAQPADAAAMEEHSHRNSGDLFTTIQTGLLFESV